MKTKKLIQNNSKKLILFFNGWSLDENIVNHLTSKKYDVMMFYDYSNLEISKEILDEINSYDEINIAAFSFGVWACGCFVNVLLDTKERSRLCETKISGYEKKHPPKQSYPLANMKNLIAINGTLIPIDNQFGISEKMFDLTLLNLSEKTYPLFFKNMFMDKPDLNKMPQRNIEDKRQELTAIKHNSKSLKTLNTIFTKVFIGSYDKIIPAKNQFAFWGDRCNNKEITKLDSGHYAFDLFRDWDEIING